MNTVNIVGNLTRAPELKRTDSGKEYSNITVAVRRTSDKTDFIPVTVWKSSAEYLVKYGFKGSRVGVTGMIVSRQYETREGEKRTVYEVWSSNIEILSRKEDVSSNEIDPLEELEGSDDELPF